MMGGQPGRGMMGIELHYQEAKLVHNCERVTNHYECGFRLPVKSNYDELTEMYMRGLSGGSPFNFNDFMFHLMDSAIAAEHYAFEFRLDTSGLWRSQPTIAQRLEDIEEQIQSINSRLP